MEQFRSVPKISDRQSTEDVDNRFRKGLADRVLPFPDLLLGAYCWGFRVKGKVGLASGRNYILHELDEILKHPKALLSLFRPGHVLSP